MFVFRENVANLKKVSIFVVYLYVVLIGCPGLRLNWLFGFVFQVFGLMREQEKTRLAEVDAEKAHYQVIQAQTDIVSYIHLRTLVMLYLRPDCL